MTAKATLALLVWIPAVLVSQEAGRYSQEEVRRLAMAIALVDYPVTQAQFRMLTGFDEPYRRWSLSSRNTGEARDVLWWHLASDTSGGSYRLRATLGPAHSETDRAPTITAASICYQSDGFGLYVLDRDEYPLSIIPYLKATLKESGLTIPEFVSRPNRTRFIDEATIRSRHDERQKAVKQKEPNSVGSAAP